MIEAFNEFLYEFGEPVVIIYRTPEILYGKPVEDERGHKVYLEEEIETIARIQLMNGTEEIVKSGILKKGDGIGRFMLDDFQYINSSSSVKLKQSQGGSLVETIFNFQSPILLKTHAEAMLKRSRI